MLSFFYPLSLSFHHYSFSYLSLCMCYSSYLCVVILHSLTPPHTHTKTSLRIIIQFNTHTQHAPVGLDTNLNPSLDRDTVTVCVRRGREGLALPMPMMDNCQGTARPSGLIFSMWHTHRRWRWSWHWCTHIKGLLEIILHSSTHLHLHFKHLGGVRRTAQGKEVKTRLWSRDVNTSDGIYHLSDLWDVTPISN